MFQIPDAPWIGNPDYYEEDEDYSYDNEPFAVYDPDPED